MSYYFDQFYEITRTNIVIFRQCIICSAISVWKRGLFISDCFWSFAKYMYIIHISVCFMLVCTQKVHIFKFDCIFWVGELWITILTTLEMNKEVEDLIQEMGNTGADKKIKNKIKATIDCEIVTYEDFLKIKYQALFPSRFRNLFYL